ncbi:MULTISPECIES: DUF6193 family natural product biosynthesis protein [Streptomyces]|uniref:Uncharacterized protein n=1 Tax=Streptomyces tsukubensis (strain DSM 42081 / NBRC 108919 / NRRL 18488 / 9993) TaxID=1114943 RepID=I2N2E8_STRT9|nr:MULTISPECIES: DUF6193 family natural product biosynthesis protein [Streptomyces]AZK95291.1 hypothetical protein B7R87_16585 [Streptomyces tsukubensis]EIF91195.1 hypothetical protein [Streptomyces tsukubensis NRRL18488]MYS62964.1 hypothetical protein [Streptomyces sp. SID5473]QKM68653.1 hypothetical protein STSU_017210 [Streptomyces tsukubensis NRRL18488]TAI43459.1 hypothetical protein EWI31_16960 [Streptomyces tsukubensis]
MDFGAGIDEICWAGGALRAAVGRTAEGLGLVLPEPDRESGRLAEYADRARGRRAMVYPPGNRCRTFQVSLDDNGTRMAYGKTADLAEAVRATAAWTGGAGLEETRAQTPFVRFRPWALVHEREPFGAVELTWQAKLDRIHMPPNDRHLRPHALLAAAYARPVLRRLMPVNSHFNLWFSTRVEESWKARVGPVVCPYDEGFYGVQSKGERIARTETPEEAVALLVAALPEGLGPAS